MLPLMKTRLKKLLLALCPRGVDTLCCLAAGALFPLAFAPVNAWWLALVLPAVLYAFTLTASTRRAASLGFWFGMGYFGVGVSWVYVSIHEFGNTPAPLALLFTLGFIAILALFFAGQLLLYKRLQQHATLNPLLFSASWVVSEGLRSVFLTGFPWLLTGMSQIPSPLQGFAPVIGVYGLSFICVCTAALLYQLVRARSLPAIISPLLLFVLVAVSGYKLSGIHWTESQGVSTAISIVQGNIPQEMKWSNEYLDMIVRRYDELTRKELGTPLIIWPESALPLPYQNAGEYLDELGASAKAKGSTIILGIPFEAENQKQYYNSILSIGRDQGRYSKYHLVPFGEYVPFSNALRGIIALLDIPMSDFIPGHDSAATLPFGNARIAPFICYEIAYSDVIRHKLPEANLLLTITNDAWFGNSLAPWQHAQMAQMRALQTGRYSILSGNDGITTVFDEQGKQIASLPQFTTAVLHSTVTLYQGATPWVTWGDTPIFTTAATLLGLAWLRRRLTRHREVLTTLPSA
jgi:apolipoprotein N-acyltransferase